MDDATDLLAAARRGDGDAAERLFTALYDELRRCAHRQLRQHASDTLSTTALVHETYLKIGLGQAADLQDRQHFMSLAARAMRQVLVDHARRRQAGKRGGDALLVTLDERAPDPSSEAFEVLALDRALGVLEAVDERAARVVNLHFFGGLTFPAIAELEGVNERTVKRDWQAARLLLAAEMGMQG